MAKSPAKVSVECPHCGFKQMEYAAARNTLCRQCGKHYPMATAESELKPSSVLAGRRGVGDGAVIVCSASKAFGIGNALRPSFASIAGRTRN